MRQLVIGHRGAAGLAPENTAAAIRTAVKLKVDVIELDMQLTKDYELVLFHDYKMDRTTGKFGVVNDLTFKQLSGLDVGSFFSKEFSSETPITLEETLKMVGGRCQIIIDIKDRNLREAEILARLLIEKIKKSKFKKQIRISSWNHYVDRYVDKEIKEAGLKNVALAYLHRKRGSPFKNLKNLNYISIHPHFLRTSKHLIREAHKLGLQVFPWGVGKKKLMKKLLKMGVDGIITDYPNRLQEVLNDYSKSTAKKR